jgi:hypothetical protein
MKVGVRPVCPAKEQSIMDERTIADLAASIAALERKCRRQGRATVSLAAALAAAILWLGVFAPRTGAAGGAGDGGVLRVRGLSVVDARGTERVFIGAPVPEPLILGKRFPRGGSMCGIILFDEDGTERSGYCTSDGYPNVLFTLDAIGRQHALFMAEPQGSTALWIWNGANSFKLNVGDDEADLKLAGGGRTIWEAPAAEAAPKAPAK